MLPVGTDACILYLPGRHSEVGELQTVGCPQIYMVFVRFGLPYGYVFHREIFGAKRFIYLIAHLERVEGDAWAYAGNDIRSLCSVGRLHPVKGFGKNAVYRSPPACMDCGNNAALPVI